MTKRQRRASCLVIVIILLLLPACRVSTAEGLATTAGKLSVHFIDVGQGASQLIIGPTGKTMLIDGGNNSEEAKIVAYLQRQQVSKVDILIATHPDADHAGGLDAVINHFDIGKIYMPKVQSNTKTFEDVLKAIKAKSLKVSTAKAGLTLEWEHDVEVLMLAPVGVYGETNEMSAVVKLSYGENSFLLTGDAEGESESDIMKSGFSLKADVLLVGHHGSHSSTSTSWLKNVQPQYAVIQSGPNNYGHPASEVLGRLKKQGSDVLRTDEVGNIIFISDGETLKVNHTDSLKDAEKTASTSNKEIKQNVYESCAAVRDAGKSPIRRGDPGFNAKLDRDGDGVACE
ncbi:MBL fold metallo-hydrolase [Paenibacillus harenae]|uniref:Beta-lactamase superfamily II metal-dependent hydrolase n=1 Tax=Paenibacillus harenae TaxID=306543 RepID=A0ABT9TZW2_PAEHA|nr:MBL fold metallo-hydrolase [Paenibacillus harenae]MDQ0112911.1 beta-lactamase superfamily II metal-dependent hydrolase [Paenibacillus harenae]